MNTEEVVVPATGNDGELEVIEVSVSVGDEIETDDTIVVLESDKATVEVPAPNAGKVAEISVYVGDKVSEGSALLKLTTANDSALSHEHQAQNVTEQTQQKPVNADIVNDQPSEKAVPTETTRQKIHVPDLGGSEQVEVIEIACAVSDEIEKDQTLIVLETDKATMEIPSPYQGELLAINLKVGDKVSAGDLLAEINARSDAQHVSGAQDSSSETGINSEVNTHQRGQEKQPIADQSSSHQPSSHHSENESLHSNATVHAGPAVRKFGREHGVDLARVKATGPKGRILVEDVTVYIKAQVQQSQSGSVSSGGSILAGLPLPDFAKFGEVSTSSLSNIHFKTAENMQRSWSIPHVTQFDEADISDMEAFRKSQKSIAQSRGIKLTPIAFLLKACAYVLKALPQFNVSLDLAKKQLIQKHYIHIGFAVDTPHGLFVPVIKDVDKKTLWEIASECQDLANRAKDKKLTASEMQGGCFTVSSLGAIGGTNFTPIVNSPEVAILGVSKAQMKPVYVGNESGHEFSARLMLPLSLSYDHRAVNGADGARFTTLLAKVLSDIRELLL